MNLLGQRSAGNYERYRGEHPIVVEGLRTQFGSHVVHDDLSLTVNRGEIIGDGVHDPEGTAQLLLDKLMSKDLLAV